jgi:hypothetical protein
MRTRYDCSVGREDRTVAALDRLAGGLLLVASAAGVGFALSLFDPKLELARLSGDLVSGLADRMRGLSRVGRSKRLAAAHAVIVLTAYFESLQEASLLLRADVPMPAPSGRTS